MTAILSMAKSDTLHKKKSPHIKEWMTQADPPKEASTFERMNDRSQLLSSNGMRHYFKELKTASGVLKNKNFVLTTGGVLKKYIHHERMECLQVLSDIYQCTFQKDSAITSVE